ncbi:hypothetical protein LCGC14_0971000 [marine sediment metagenome]|uniref:Uncharacterized protein n=1 Tax=marine sediment metagenome TaxID=412755 RepID=A0A0F9NXX3_9ZZZZ
MENVELYLGIALFVLTIATGAIVKMRKTIKELKEFLNAIKLAMADGKITVKELDAILKEGDDVVRAAFKVITLINRR